MTWPQRQAPRSRTNHWVENPATWWNKHLLSKPKDAASTGQLRVSLLASAEQRKPHLCTWRGERRFSLCGDRFLSLEATLASGFVHSHSWLPASFFWSWRVLGQVSLPPWVLFRLLCGIILQTVCLYYAFPSASSLLPVISFFFLPASTIFSFVASPCLSADKSPAVFFFLLLQTYPS